MLNVGHEAITRLLYAHGSIPEDVDVRYDIPTKEWADSLTRPTVSFFLFDVRENTEIRETNLQTFRTSGKAERRMPPRRIDVFYCVAALATEVADEHELLWRVLATLLKYQQLPDDVLSDTLRRLDPPLTARLGEKEDSDRLSDLWSSLGVAPHPALCYIVTMPLDLEIAIQAPLVLTRLARYKTPAQTFERAIQIGGVVRTNAGVPVEGLTVRIGGSAKRSSTTDVNGEFRLQGVSEGRVSLDVVKDGKVRKSVELGVPAEAYEILLDE
jgi:hypothetical protein